MEGEELVVGTRGVHMHRFRQVGVPQFGLFGRIEEGLLRILAHSVEVE